MVDSIEFVVNRFIVLGYCAHSCVHSSQFLICFADAVLLNALSLFNQQSQGFFYPLVISVPMQVRIDQWTPWFLFWEWAR